MILRVILYFRYRIYVLFSYTENKVKLIGDMSDWEDIEVVAEWDFSVSYDFNEKDKTIRLADRFIFYGLCLRIIMEVGQFKKFVGIIRAALKDTMLEIYRWRE